MGDERVLACADCGAVLGMAYVGERIPGGHECCPACEGDGWVWEFTNGEPVKAPCHRCGSRQLALPSEAEVNRMAEEVR